MKARDTSSTVLEIVKSFEDAAQSRRKPKSQELSPFSMRLTQEERDFLEKHSDDKSWAEFIRERVFGEERTKRRLLRHPPVNDEKLGEVLANLGQSRLASNVNQLAKAANMGTLDISDETDRQLQEASAAILAMREALFMALGLKAQ